MLIVLKASGDKSIFDKILHDFTFYGMVFLYQPESVVITQGYRTTLKNKEEMLKDIFMQVDFSEENERDDHFFMIMNGHFTVNSRNYNTV